MIIVKNLTKQYNKITVLDHVNFSIKKGSIVGIIGSNGAGKSTLISIIAGIVKATQGEVIIGDCRIGYVPQEITLFPNFTVKENLDYWDTISNNHSRKKSKENIRVITEVAHLDGYLSKKVSTLSGGLKRRLNIAIALLSHPEILIMDEPTVGMDIHSRAEITDFIKTLSSDGTTILYVSHHSDEIEALCDHIICLNQGKLVFKGSLDALKSQFPGDDIRGIILKISSPATLEERSSNEALDTY